MAFLPSAKVFMKIQKEVGSFDKYIWSFTNGKVIKKNYVGKNIENYDSMLVVSHFKGHPMGGYGGVLKQLAIGFASSKGKRYIHQC